MLQATETVVIETGPAQQEVVVSKSGGMSEGGFTWDEHEVFALRLHC
jgi:hypothetical protein